MDLTFQQAAVLAAISRGINDGPRLSHVLETAGLTKKGPIFYGLVGRLRDRKLVSVSKTVNGVPISVFKLTARGREGLERARAAALFVLGQKT